MVNYSFYCQECGKPSGRLGDHLRTYTIKTPLSEKDIVLCWPCAEKSFAKNRKHWSIRDKVHA